MVLRAASIACAAALVSFVPLPRAADGAFARAGSAIVLTSLESSVLADLNAVRAAHGLVPLRLSPSLTAAASSHCRQMVADGFFAHDSPNGLRFARRVGEYYGSAGYRSWLVGENLLWSAGRLDAAAAVAQWMSSPEHRDNLLSPAWREIGVSAVAAADAPGVYRHLDVVVIAADFGVRA